MTFISLYWGFCKGSNISYTYVFIRNVEILAEIWPKIYFQSFLKMMCVYSDFPITIPIDSSPGPALIKKMLQPNSKL